MKIKELTMSRSLNCGLNGSKIKFGATGMLEKGDTIQSCKRELEHQLVLWETEIRAKPSSYEEFNKL